MTEPLKLHIVNSKYVASAVRPDQYPPGELVEIAFIGRSNVGKSSLINSLCRRHGLALVSKQPGKTKTINFFTVTAKISDEERLDWFLVDLPGYGYARTGGKNMNLWSKFINDYIANSPRLKLVCLLVDIRHPGLDIDKEAIKWLQGHNVPVQIVATKADKLGKNEVAKNVASIKRELGVAAVLPFSAEKGLGREELLDVIGEFLLK